MTLKPPPFIATIADVLRPVLNTSSLHDQGPGEPQKRDREHIKEDAVEHPSLGEDPAVGSISAEQAEADMEAAIEEARSGALDRT